MNLKEWARSSERNYRVSDYILGIGGAFILLALFAVIAS